jgi:hypothetical protein
MARSIAFITPCLSNVASKLNAKRARPPPSSPGQVAALLRTTKGLMAGDMARLARFARKAKDK